MFVEHSEKHEAQRIMAIHDKLVHSLVFLAHMAWWTAVKARGAAVKARGAAVKARGSAVKARGAAVKARGTAVKARQIAIKARARRGYGDTKGPGDALNTRSCAHYFAGGLKIPPRGFGLTGRTKTLPCLNCVPYLQNVMKFKKKLYYITIWIWKNI